MSFRLFRHEAQRQAFLFSRYHRRSSAPRIRLTDQLYQQHKELLQPLLDFLCSHGRAPDRDP